MVNWLAVRERIVGVREGSEQVRHSGEAGEDSIESHISSDVPLPAPSCPIVNGVVRAGATAPPRASAREPSDRGKAAAVDPRAPLPQGAKGSVNRSIGATTVPPLGNPITSASSPVAVTV